MKPENLKCPICAGPMVPRTNSREGTKFWGCKSFPRCNGTRDSMGLSKDERMAADKDESDEPQYGFKRSRRYD